MPSEAPEGNTNLIRGLLDLDLCYFHVMITIAIWSESTVIPLNRREN